MVVKEIINEVDTTYNVIHNKIADAKNYHNYVVTNNDVANAYIAH